jgi:hypothetical protein
MPRSHNYTGRDYLSLLISQYMLTVSATKRLRDPLCILRTYSPDKDVIENTMRGPFSVRRTLCAALFKSHAHICAPQIEGVVEHWS